MINIPKGTKDVLPKDSYKWGKVRQVAEKLANLYNMHEVITPTFEHTELFVRSDGEGSDVVSKEMYTFLDKGERSITLKPEGTAGVARCFIENGLFNETLPLKMYYITPCFRYERPQNGRLREHHQFGVEIYGANTISSDVEAISIAMDFYKSFGVEPIVAINSIGCADCRREYINRLVDYVSKRIDHMCPDCVRRLKVNPFRILDCKVPECKEQLKDAPVISDCLCDKCKSHYSDIKKMLTSLNIKYKEDPNLVRGLDYYTDLVFEFTDATGQCPGALGGGGRYNNLVESLGGKSTPVVGFGIGIERLLLYLDSINKPIEDTNTLDVYVASMTTDECYVMHLCKKLRERGISCDTDLMMRSIKAQFKYADKINAKFVVTIGEEEVAENKVTVKDMRNGTQIKIWTNDLYEYIIKNR